MLRIPCPYCGLRDQIEFRCGGEASIVRPADPEAASDSDWANYLFYRNNRMGRHTERWLHTFGCGQWFLVERDTVSNEITSSRRIGQGQGDD